MVGNTANKKNDRWSQGTFDDIQIFHRVLNENEVKELYESPNPNRTKIIIDYVLIGLSIIALIVLVAYLLVASQKRRLRKQEEKFILNSKLLILLML